MKFVTESIKTLSCILQGCSKQGKVWDLKKRGFYKKIPKRENLSLMKYVSENSFTFYHYPFVSLIMFQNNIPQMLSFLYSIKFFSSITNFIQPYLYQFFNNSHGLNGYRKPSKRPFNQCQSYLEAINIGQDIKQINR